MSYLKINLRHLLKHKWFSLINLVGLSLGIMCSIIILLFTSSHLGTDKHHRDADRIHRVVLEIETPDGKTEYDAGSSLPMSGVLSDEFSQIEETAFCMKFYSTPTITIQSNENVVKYKEENIAAYADNNFIQLFDHTFIAGGGQTALINPKTVVLSERQARKYFGTVDVIGKWININNIADLIVTGVFADQTRNSDLKFDVLVSLPTLKILNPKYQDQNFTWIGSNNWTFIKLKDEAAAGDIERSLPAFALKYLGPDLRHWRLHLQSLSAIHFDTQYDGVISKTILWVLMGVSLVLILVVSINYINLSVAQSHYRAKEIGLRKYLGGSKAQLFYQFISETGMVVFVSVCIALAGVYVTLPVINAWLQTDLNLIQLMAPDKLLYLMLFVLGLTLVAGYYPAVRLSGFSPIKAIQGKGLYSHKNQRLGKVLITTQYAVALFFVVSTVVIIQQSNFLVSKDLGFSKDAILTLQVPKSNFDRMKTFQNEIAALSAVESVSLHNQSPMASSMDGGFIKYDNRSQWEDFIVRDRWADDKFITTYSLSLTAGRNIILHDSITEVLVNHALLEKLGVDDPEEALGKSILFDNSAVTGIIVGVVNDFHHRSLQNGIEPVAIYPLPGVFKELGIRLVSSRDNETIAAIEHVWKRNFPDDVFHYTFLDESIQKMYRVEQTTQKLMIVFASVSIITCLIGILGLLAFTAHQRTKELSIRKVLGASVESIIVLLCRQYFILFAIAFFVSLPLTYVLVSKWLNGFAYHIELKWFIFAGPGILMILITLLIIGGQSLKIALVNPTESIKNE